MKEIIAKSIISQKNNMNIYRGCTHGCIYCDSRSEVYGKTYDFENIEVKVNAIELIKKELSKIIRNFCKENNMMYGEKEIFSYIWDFPQKSEQLSLF